MRAALGVVLLVVGCGTGTTPNSRVSHVLTAEQEARQFSLLAEIVKQYPDNLDLQGRSVTEFKELLSLADDTVVQDSIKKYGYDLDGELDDEYDGTGWLVIVVEDDIIKKIEMGFAES